jgi:hypothetical protein
MSMCLTSFRRDRIVATPPISLVESYYKCSQLPTIAFYNALGISAGIVSLIVTAATFSFLPFVVYKLNKVDCAEVVRVAVTLMLANLA